MPNRLAKESSPYLRQHADNPVDWYPWGDEARAEAKRLNRPLLISIGYAACHWCHVMAHESFEDPEVAAVMNDRFVNVKVDREERPDVDAVYMEATQAMTGSGGWPMTVFATPDGEPFYCGTYFPPRGAGGRPGFMELCLGLAEAYAERPDDVRAQADKIVEHLRRTEFSSGELPTMADVDNAVDNLKAMHSSDWGGFGTAPKFPQPMAIDVLLDAYRRTGDDDALTAAVTSLDAMAAGGIYDHLGGGFARYSVDNRWLVPHFEKMLYDQAQLVRVYTHAWQLTGLARHRQVVAETVAYVLRDLRHAAGGFFSSEDADSEGVEGKFSVWTPGEITDVLGDDPEAAQAALTWWSVTEDGNFEGRSILHRIDNRTELMRPPAVERARTALLAAREGRVRPGLDDKVLTEWNAMMIGALTEAAMALGEPAWLDAAIEAATFLVDQLHDDRGWLRSWQSEGGARHLAYAADHATLVDAFTRLGEATGDAVWTERAVACAEALLDRFSDHENGGFFTTAHDAEALIARPKAVQDNPIPSENSAAAVALLRLGALVEESRYREAAIGVLRLTGRFAGQHPTAFGALLAAVPLLDTGVTEVTVTGTGTETDALCHVYWARWRPDAVLRHEPTDAPGSAMVCRNSVCDLPVSSPEALATSLDG